MVLRLLEFEIYSHHSKIVRVDLENYIWKGLCLLFVKIDSAFISQESLCNSLVILNFIKITPIWNYDIKITFSHHFQYFDTKWLFHVVLLAGNIEHRHGQVLYSCSSGTKNLFIQSCKKNIPKSFKYCRCISFHGVIISRITIFGLVLGGMKFHWVAYGLDKNSLHTSFKSADMKLHGFYTRNLAEINAT